VDLAPFSPYVEPPLINSYPDSSGHPPSQAKRRPP